MQEEVTRKTIALAIKTAKLDGKVLQAALRKLLQLYRKARDTPHHGKQTLKQLMRHGTGVSNIEITDANIKAFESTAKKYGIDFALKKADDRYLVFFKGRDADVLTAAFREFSKKKLDKERKPSVRRDLAEKKAEAAAVFLRWLTEQQRNLEFAADTGYMPVSSAAFDAIADYPFEQQSYQRLYDVYNEMRIQNTPLSEPGIVGYHAKAKALYDSLRQLQKDYPQRLADGETLEALAEETWQLLCDNA